MTVYPSIPPYYGQRLSHDSYTDDDDDEYEDEDLRFYRRGGLGHDGVGMGGRYRRGCRGYEEDVGEDEGFMFSGDEDEDEDRF